MHRLLSLFLLLIPFLSLSGCAYDKFEHFMYDAASDKQCIKDTGLPKCDPERPSYEEYKRQLNETITDNRNSN